jgi:hypothetical protein
MEENVKNAEKMLALVALGCLGAGLLLNGCKSAPELTQANAQSLIQAKYDQSPTVGANVMVDRLGLGEGAAANLWERTKVYPNRFWADFALTAEGKKALKLQSGGDVIEWRPQSEMDKDFAVTVVTLAAKPLKAHDVSEIQDESGGGKSADFTASVNLDGVPSSLQNIAHNPGNKLSSKHTATFALDNGAWKLQAIN